MSEQGQGVGVEDSEQWRGANWARTVTEEEARYLGVNVHTVKVLFILQAVVLQRVGGVEGQALAGGAADKHRHHQVALSRRRQASWGRGEGEAASSPPRTPPLPARLTLTGE